MKVLPVKVLDVYSRPHGRTLNLFIEARVAALASSGCGQEGPLETPSQYAALFSRT